MPLSTMLVMNRFRIWGNKLWTACLCLKEAVWVWAAGKNIDPQYRGPSLLTVLQVRF